MLLALERAQDRPIFGRRLRVDVYDASGAKLDFGAITSALEFEYSLKLDEVGAFRMALPADDAAVGELDQGYELRCYREGEGLVFRGLIDAIAWSEDGSGRRTAEVTGASIGRKLVFANTLLGLAFEGTALSSVVSTLLTGTGWSAGALDSPATTLLARYDGASAWEALNHAARVFGLHVREDNLNAEVDIGAFGSASGVTLQNATAAVMARLYENTDLYPLVNVQVLEESQDLWNRVIPLGAGEGVNQLTLRYATRSSPYTIASDTGPDGQTYYYLEDAASVASIGARTKVLFAKDAIPLANSSAGFIAAANALYDVAATWLARHSETRASYAVETAGLTHIVSGSPRFQVGETMRLNYRGAVQDADGTKRLFKSIGADCWLIGFQRSFDASGADRWQLELSTVDRSGEDDAARMGEVYQAMHALQVSLRNYTFQAPYILGRSSLNASNTAQLTVKLDANISLLHLANLTWIIRPLRSNVTAAASDGSSTPTSSSGGSSTPTTSSGGSSTPTSSSAGSHRHQMFDYVSVDSTQLLAAAFSDSDAQTAYIATGSPGVDHTHGLSEMQGHTHNVNWDGSFGVGLVSIKSKSSGGADLTHSFLMVNQINQDIYTWEAAADHSHTVTIAAHTHSVTIAAHTHTVTISPHTHGMTYGIYNASTPSNPAVTVTINGVDRTSALGGPWNTVNAEVTVDITAYLQDGSTEIPLQQSNTIVFGASVLCDVEAICRIDMTRSALLPV